MRAQRDRKALAGNTQPTVKIALEAKQREGA